MIAGYPNLQHRRFIVIQAEFQQRCATVLLLLLTLTPTRMMMVMMMMMMLMQLAHVSRQCDGTQSTPHHADASARLSTVTHAMVAFLTPLPVTDLHALFTLSHSPNCLLKAD